MANQKYKLELLFTQCTDGESDNETLMREFSTDPVMHAIKTQIMTRHLTECLNNMTKEFTDLAISQGGTDLPVPPPGKPAK